MRRSTTVLIALVFGALVGCTPEPEPAPTPSPTSEPRAFTVATTAAVRHTDPVAATGTADQDFVTNVFQRLMKTPPGEQVPKPDLAQDCVFDSELIYTCTIGADASFANGDPLTADDVAFSIVRARRLAPTQGPRSLWGSLSRVEVIDPTTVRFVLTRADNQFWFALATPEASIVQESAYPADEVLTDPLAASGSGPFVATSVDADRIVYERNENYAGGTTAILDRVEMAVLPDSASVEEAMRSGEVDAVWRGLNNPAHTRLARQIDTNGGRSDSGFEAFTVAGGRVQRLLWQQNSPGYHDTALRMFVRDALQDERTVDSILPPQVPGYRASFVAGGQPDSGVPWTGTRTLRIAGDPSVPDMTDQLGVIRTRLESSGAVSVELVAVEDNPDLILTDNTAAGWTAIAWLREYLDRPTLASGLATELLRTSLGQTTDAGARDDILARLQSAAAVDATVVPVWQSDERLYLRQDYGHDAASFGSGWQLGLWGFREIG